MNTKIEFIPDIIETILPIIKLTKSRNGQTGTATFVFLYPDIFLHFPSLSLIESMTLYWEKQKISTRDVQIFFKKGKPYIIRSIFLFKNSQEWFNFLQFMSFYSKESGLTFSDIIEK
uniref:Photosystem II reaction center Psb28 protein n=1 Tax=Neotessella volvocina TaxID=52559 RepID=A0A3G2R0N7_9STRA|nr:photosystem II protein W [Neotessella volvocina]